MDIPEKLTFIHDLINNVKTEIVRKVGNMPKEWDGIELRWYAAEMFKEMIVDPTAKHEYKKRYNEYRYFRFAKGL